MAARARGAGGPVNQSTAFSPFARHSDVHLHVPEDRAPLLIIADTASKRLALKAVLEPLGYEMIEADSGAAGLRRVMTDEVAVILLDVRMPDMDGFETAGLIRLRAQTELTPIIFITAHASDELGPERFAAGAVDFITGEVDPDELRAKVSALADLHLRMQAHIAEARNLRVTTDQLRLLTEEAPIGIFRTDTDNRYIYTNARWSELTGVPSEAAAGAEWHIMLGADWGEAGIDFETSDPGTEMTSRLMIPPGTGSPARCVLLAARLVSDEGQPSGWVGTLTDITAEAEAESALVAARDLATEASRLKSDFIANMSHEIRSPMAGVVGWTEVLLDTDLDTEQRGFVETISRAGHTLMAVIDEVLDFSKLETGMVDLESVEFSVQSVVDDVVDVLSVAADSKGIELSSVVDPVVPASVVGDPNRVRQVLTNLVGNAIKFTDHGGVVISVGMGTEDRSRNEIRFEVVDSGIGVAPDKLEMIFEHFTQGDTSITREYGGTGLGLAISSQLTRLMGGQVGVTSELGAGSTFWFTIGAGSESNSDA